jgi:hypothetical protein
VASRKRRHHSIPRPHFCISGLLTSFVYVFPFKSYSTFSFGLEIPIGAEIFFFFFWGGGFGNSRPLNACVHQRDPEKARPGVKSRRLSHHACLCDAPFGRYAIARKKYKKKIGGSEEKRTWRDVRRRNEPSSNRTSYERCGKYSSHLP